MSSLIERISVLETKVISLEDDVQKLPTRPELEVFRNTLTDVVLTQKEIMETQKEIVKFIDKWKLLGFVMIILGAIITKVFEWASTGWNHLTNQ